ncbi:ORF6N domain-containing protein [Pedobacter ureilyticus]|uniref:ORF6N domain-containing protein n=1 Tax=Pedobacter ureilyticus TaxID=1393051 RepID=A0ABW9J5P2_9SPHI|nr:ORF6N domain-containing protein [Pedobacter helvus]
MLDSDLAELYGVETKRLNEQVGEDDGNCLMCFPNMVF